MYGGVFGQAVDESGVWETRRKIAYVAQEPEIGADTARQALERPFAYKANASLRGNLHRLPALPGMMTGVILAGADPMAAIKYQIAIMIAIFSGTAVTVYLAIRLTVKSSFNAFGILDRTVWRQAGGSNDWKS